MEYVPGAIDTLSPDLLLACVLTRGRPGHTAQDARWWGMHVCHCIAWSVLRTSSHLPSGADMRPRIVAPSAK